MSATLDLIDSRLMPLLQERLRSVFHEQRWARNLELVSIKTNPYASSWSTGILSCRTATGTFQLFCKRSRETAFSIQGHNRGIAYEQAVYQKILKRSGLPQPQYLGAFIDEEQVQWLLLESLEDYTRWTLTSTPEIYALRLASWLGQFHAEQQNWVAMDAAEFDWMRSHDEGYFRHWIDRTVEFSAPFRDEVTWLEDLSKAAVALLPDFLGSPRTVVHGELFPHNVMVKDEVVLPIDWESAGIGAGEEDLATMTDNWPYSVAVACRDEYVRSRWPDGEPAHFNETFAAARLFHQFRWIGVNAERAATTARWRYEHLRLAGVRLGLIPA